MTKKITIAALSVLLAALGGSVLAQPGGFGHRSEHFGPRAGAMRLQVLAVALELSDDQVTEAKDLFADFGTSNSASMQQRRELHEQLRTSLDSGDPEACAIGQQMLQMHRLGEEARAVREGLRSSLAAILTQEQQEKFDALEAARKSMPGARMMRHGGMHGFGGGPTGDGE